MTQPRRQPSPGLFYILEVNVMQFNLDYFYGNEAGPSRF